MSWTVYLNDDDGDTIVFDKPVHQAGGTIQLGECYSAEMHSVTYNYSDHYYKLYPDEGFRTFNGMLAQTSIPLLEYGLKLLDPKTETLDYWAPTEGNARKVLETMLAWAKEAPNAIWDVQ